MASALLELSRYAEKTANGRTYYNVAEIMIKTLSSDTYKTNQGTNGGFILKHSVGHLPQKSEVDVSLTYADYYYIEAMARYKGMNQPFKSIAN